MDIYMFFFVAETLNHVLNGCPLCPRVFVVSGAPLGTRFLGPGPCWFHGDRVGQGGHPV